MAITLSPYPAVSMVMTREAARTYLKENSATLDGVSDDRIDNLAEFASALIEDFASDAPDAVKNEASFRLVSYSQQRIPSPQTGLEKMSVGPVELDFVHNRNLHPSLFHNSGARALLYSFRSGERRALLVGD